MALPFPSPETFPALARKLVFLRRNVLLPALLLVLVGLTAPAEAVTLEGRVWNGTTSRPAAGAEVEFVQLQQGMTPIARAVADSQGRFRFEGVEAFGSAPALLRVPFQGATYSQPVASPQSPPSDLQILVYEATPDSRIVAVRQHILFLFPRGNTLDVIEQVFLENESAPPRTYVDPQATYRFTLPGPPREAVRATVEGPAGMPINQTPVPATGEDRFAIIYPIRPGETSLRLEYQLDYQSPRDLVKTFDQPALETHIVTSGEGVQVTGESLVQAGVDPASGFLAYRATPVGNVVRVQVSGEAPAREAQLADTGESSGVLSRIPDPASQRRWVLLIAFGLIMLAGFAYLYTR